MKLGILKAYDNKAHENYITACKDLNIDYEIIDIFAPNWIELIQNSNCDGFLHRAPNDIFEFKTIFDERLYFLEYELKKKIYPSFKETYIYENKRLLSYWLSLNNIPHPKTLVFSKKDDVKKYLDNLNDKDFPLVLKSSIGAASTGVKILKSKRAVLGYAKKIFGIFNRAMTFGLLRYKKIYGIPIPLFGRIQKHYMIIQEFKKIKWEWRIIRIGDSFFGYQKLLTGKFASGSKKVGYEKPPLKLLELVKEITEKGNFYSVAVDIFETEDNQYFVNEIQSMFGATLKTESFYINQEKKEMKFSYDSNKFAPELYVDGKYGRYLLKNNKFVFEEGFFNQNGSFNLRVEHFLKLLSESKK